MDSLNVTHIFSFALAVCAGAFLRFTISTFVGNFLTRLLPSPPIFPWAIMVVNLLGCFGFGMSMGLGEKLFPLDEAERIILFAGFFGSFTTFSTFIFDIYSLWIKTHYKELFFFIFGHIALGVALTYVGLYIFS